MLKMSKVLNVEMDIDELRNDEFRYGILNELFVRLFIVTILSSLNQALVLLMANFLCFRLSVIKGCVALLSEFQTLYQELPSYREIFSPILDMMDKLPVNKYPLTLQVHSCYTSIGSVFNRARAFQNPLYPHHKFL